MNDPSLSFMYACVIDLLLKWFVTCTYGCTGTIPTICLGDAQMTTSSSTYADRVGWRSATIQDARDAGPDFALRCRFRELLIIFGQLEKNA
jgi:hypothetical protein